MRHYLKICFWPRLISTLQNAGINPSCKQLLQLMYLCRTFSHNLPSEQFQHSLRCFCDHYISAKLSRKTLSRHLPANYPRSQLMVINQLATWMILKARNSKFCTTSNHCDIKSIMIQLGTPHWFLTQYRNHTTLQWIFKNKLNNANPIYFKYWKATQRLI